MSLFVFQKMYSLLILAIVCVAIYRIEYTFNMNEISVRNFSRSFENTNYA